MLQKLLVQRKEPSYRGMLTVQAYDSALKKSIGWLQQSYAEVLAVESCGTVTTAYNPLAAYTGISLIGLEHTLSHESPYIVAADFPSKTPLVQSALGTSNASYLCLLSKDLLVSKTSDSLWLQVRFFRHLLRDRPK